VLRVNRKIGDFHLFAHRVDRLLLLEWEKNPGQADRPVRNLYAELRNGLATLQATQSLDDFFHAAVYEIQDFTGFDRVLAYQFLPAKSEKIIAEARQAGSESHLRQHYPASDIPEPARRMFSLLWLRYLPDTFYQPVPIVPELNPVPQSPLVSVWWQGGTSR
jgi:chemotaxis family two-component system sensor kinase Cph1